MNTPLTDIVPSGRGFATLLEAFRASGGTAPGDVVAGLLTEHRRGEAISLATLVHSGQIFSIQWCGSAWIPMFQFNADDLSVAAGPRQVRTQLPELWSGWTVALWFALPDERLGWHRPVDLLTRDFAAVVGAAQAATLVDDMTGLLGRRQRDPELHT